MKIIFLDIDGVINTPKTPHNGLIGALEPELVARFNDVVKRTGAKVVLSSTWRRIPTWSSVLLAGGFNIDDFVGSTSMIGQMVERTRGDEVKEWVDAADKTPGFEVEKYAIIDDDNDFLPEQADHLWRTDPNEGLTEFIAERIIEYFNG